METTFEPLDWSRMFIGQQPYLYYLEVVLKVVIVFCILLLLLRMLGKRGQSSLSPMRQLLLIALGSSAGDVMLYPTVALGYAALILIGITGLTILLDVVKDHAQPVEDYVEPRPRVLVRDGVIDFDTLNGERTSERELYAAMRCAGARSLEQVEMAILEVTGRVSVFLNDRTPSDEDLLDYLRKGSEAERPTGRPHRGDAAAGGRA